MSKRKRTKKHKRKEFSWEDARLSSDGAVRQDISVLRDHLSAYVANVKKAPVIVEKYNEPVAVIISIDEYKKGKKKKKRVRLSEKQRKARIEELLHTPIEEWDASEMKDLFNPTGEVVDIEKLKREAWMSTLT